MSVADASGQQIAADRARSLRLRQSILKWAFEGRLVDQDPNDEPAEKLLARIRAARAADAPRKEANARRRKGAA
jgi:type I restriction enzyme S subunit